MKSVIVSAKCGVRPILVGCALFSLLAEGTAQAPPDYHPAIENETQFDELSAPSPFPGEVERTTKFLLPARDDPGLLGSVFQNVARFPFHREFMVAVFPERFPALTEDGYRLLVERRASRQYFAGSLSHLRTAQGVI